jgi:hypothetical protein
MMMISLVVVTAFHYQVEASSFKAGRFVEVIGNVFCFRINSMWLLTPQSIGIVRWRLEELVHIEELNGVSLPQ